MAWTNIANTDIDIDSPITEALMTSIRDNAVHNNDRTVSALPFFGDGNDGAIVHSGSGTIEPGVYFHTNFTINSGVTKTLSHAGSLVIFCSGTCTIAGTLNLSGSGCAGGNGETGPGNADYGGGGASSGYGGSGGASDFASGGDAGGSFDNAQLSGSAFSAQSGGLAPNGSGATTQNGARRVARGGLLNRHMLGAGGGGGSYNAGGSNGGNGGGSLIICANTINFTSTGVSNTSGTNGQNKGGGGGGGGQIWIARTWTADAGTRNLAGGTSPGGGGSGGAGPYLKVIADPTV